MEGKNVSIFSIGSLSNSFIARRQLGHHSSVILVQVKFPSIYLCKIKVATVSLGKFTFC